MMWGMNDLDTALFVSWFLLVMACVITVAYYREQVDYYKERWLDAEAYTVYLMRLYRGELMPEDAEAEGKELQIDTGE